MSESSSNRSFSLNEIPGLIELLERSKEIEVATREDAWLATTRSVAGQRIRTMTVRDFTILLQFRNPLIARQIPTPDEFGFFLWTLSTEIEKWHGGGSWRRWPLIRNLERMQCYFHGRKVADAIELKQLESLEWEWMKSNPDNPFTIPDESAYGVALKQAFAYIDDMFLDKPASLQRSGTQSGMCYLTSWFDAMQSEYHLPTSEIWKMEIPVLFARMKAIQKRHSKNAVPEFNEHRDRIFQNIMRGLNSKLYTADDLMAGRVDLEKNCLRNN